MLFNDWLKNITGRVSARTAIQPTEQNKPGRKLYTVVAVDGGGMRGLIAARVIQELEERLGGPISEHVDLMVGTSTGGIITMGLTVPDPDQPGKPRYTASQIAEFYTKSGPDCFPKSPFTQIRQIFTAAYSGKRLETVFKRYFGDAKMSDSLTSTCLTAYDMEKRDALLMMHRKGHPDSKKDYDFRVTDALRATTAAPTYFEPAETFSVPKPDSPNPDARRRERFVLVDGGIYANNPSMVGFMQAFASAPPDADIVVVSIGTGTSKQPYPLKQIQGWGQIGWINPYQNVPILSASMDGQASAAVDMMTVALGGRHFRFDAPLKSPGRDDGPNEAYDDASPANIEALEHFSRRLIRNNHSQLEQVVALLKQRKVQNNPPPPAPPAANAPAAKP